MNRKIYIGIYLVTIITCALASGFFLGSNMGYNVGYPEGFLVGYNRALKDVAELLQQKNIVLDWQYDNNGTYKLTVRTPDGTSAFLGISVNLLVEHKDSNGHLVSTGHGAGTFTNLGKNWTIQQILYASGDIAGFVSGGGTSGIPVPGNTGINATTAALYLGDSTAADSAATDIVQPSETQLDGMARLKETSAYYAAGTSTGTLGQFNVTTVKTCVTLAITIAEWGLYYRPYTVGVNADINSLICYDAGPGSKNYAIGDTSTETWTVTFT